MHVASQREDWQNKLVNAIFKEADVLVLEKLNVAHMLRNNQLAKAISDSSWSQFAWKCMRKAEFDRGWTVKRGLAPFARRSELLLWAGFEPASTT